MVYYYYHHDFLPPPRRVPSHVGHESVALEAKKAALKSPEFISIKFRNFFLEIRKRTKEIWNHSGGKREEIYLS